MRKNPICLRGGLTAVVAAIALTWAVPVGIAVAAQVAFFDSAAALLKPSAAAVLQLARKQVAKARQGQHDLADALAKLGLLELDFGHAKNAYAALDEARQLLEQDPANRAQALGAVWVGLACTFLQGWEQGVEEGDRRKFAGWRLLPDEWLAKIVMTARQGLRILEENGYGESSEAYRARILLSIDETYNEDALAQAAALREEMTRVVPDQPRLFIDLFDIEAAIRVDQRAEEDQFVKDANEALALARRAFGEQHPLTAVAYERLASATDDEKAADHLLLKSLSIWEKIDTPDSLVDRYRRVGSVYLDNALPAYSTYFDKAIAQATKVHGSGSVQVLEVYAAILEHLDRGGKDTSSASAPYSEALLRRATAMAERMEKAPPGLREALYSRMHSLLLTKQWSESNTVRWKRIEAQLKAFEKKISGGPSPHWGFTSPAEIAGRARSESWEEGARLYQLALDIWAAEKPPWGGLAEAMVEMTTEALSGRGSEGKVAVARDFLDRAIGFVTGEDEQVTRAFLHLARAACLRAEGGAPEAVERDLRTGFAALAQGVKRDIVTELDTKTLLTNLFGWFAPPSPEDSPIVAAFALASVPTPLPSETALEGRNGLDGLAVLSAAFNDLLAASAAGRNEAALAFLHRVGGPGDPHFIFNVRSAATALRSRDGDEFVETAWHRAERLHGLSHPITFALVLSAVTQQFLPAASEDRNFDLRDDLDPVEARERWDKALQTLALAEQMAPSVPTIDDKDVNLQFEMRETIESIAFFGHSLNDEVGRRLRDLSKTYAAAEAFAEAHRQYLLSRGRWTTLRPGSHETSLAQILDGFLSLRLRSFKGEVRHEALEGRRREAIEEALTAAGQPDALAAALKAALDALQLAEEQLQVELRESSKRWDFKHRRRRAYYLFALHLLNRVQLEAPELKDKAIEAAVTVVQRVLRSQVGHAALTKCSVSEIVSWFSGSGLVLQ